MAALLAATAITHQPGKAPVLYDVSPSGLLDFQRSAKLYYHAKSVKDDEDKVGTYNAFITTLLKRAVPRDYVWDAKGRIRSARQGKRDYEDWADSLRTEQLALTERILGTREFVKALLYEMDVELCAVLRRGDVLRNSGYHVDDLNQVASSSMPTVVTPIDYDAFDREARDEWSKVEARRCSNAAQVKQSTKKAANLSVSGGPVNCKPSTAATMRGSSGGSSGTPRDDTLRPAPLTTLERDWLSANDRCFKCRKVHVGHTLRDCATWAPAGFVVKVPAGWTNSNGLPSVSSTQVSATTPRIARIAAIQDDEVDIPESFADDTDTDTDGFVAPLKDPYDIILGVPFLRRHRLFLAHHPDLVVLVERQGRLVPLDATEVDEDDSVTYGPATLTETLTRPDGTRRQQLVRALTMSCMASLKDKTEELASEKADMSARAAKLLHEFHDLFPSSLPPLSPDYLAKTRTQHCIRLVDDKIVHNQRGFWIPRKWRESWKRMLDEYLVARRLRPSSSPYALAAFVVPKKDPTADPRWVNDYRKINANTIKDWTPLPLPDVVLADAARAKVWGKIDMTNAFFQSPMHKEDIEKTAIKTPWGLFEWTVMPQGLCNAPATHQARVNEALQHLIGKCCEAFVDHVIIYSHSMNEHEQNCRLVLSALREAGLYCSPKKTDLFTTRTEFLGHIISRKGIEADSSKTDKIKNWARPRTVTQVRGFLGVVQYLRKFIPQLADHTAVLTPLTRKGLTSIELLWGAREEKAFSAIKRIVTSLPVLRPVDQDSGVPIWLMTDTSKVGVGGVLLQGDDW
ncbi:hypothetical protein JCM3770_005419 [Rhodotorula araucariae]